MLKYFIRIYIIFVFVFAIAGYIHDKRISNPNDPNLAFSKDLIGVSDLIRSGKITRDEGKEILIKKYPDYESDKIGWYIFTMFKDNYKIIP